MTTIPAKVVFQLLETLERACDVCFDNISLWNKLNEARANVHVYLVQEIEPIKVEVKT